MLTKELQTTLTRHPLGLAFDIDGTLSPTAPIPSEAKLYPGVRSLLRQAKRKAHVAIITGRAIYDGANMINVEGLTYIGTHGLEWCEGLPQLHSVEVMPAANESIQAGKYLLNLVKKELEGLDGLFVERKRFGGSLHYRRCSNYQEARRLILSCLEEPARQMNMQLVEGKQVVEVRPHVIANKGRAIRRLVGHFALQSILFAGDDSTDLDALLEINRLRQEGLTGFAIVVKHPDTSPVLLQHADIIVEGVEKMVELLHEIVAFI